MRQVSEEVRNAITWMNETRGERYLPPLWTRRGRRRSPSRDSSRSEWT
jgi:hypothetical protein